MRWFGLLLLVLGCRPKTPAHLLVPTLTPSETPIHTLDDALVVTLRGDPLGRSPILIDPQRLRALDGGGPVAEWSATVGRLERGEGSWGRTLHLLETKSSGTAAVPLVRGTLLRRAEDSQAGLIDREGARPLALLTPILPGDALQEPLEVLDGERATRTYGQRHVLQAWLHHPRLPRGAVVQALSAPTYDGLRQTPTGRLLVAEGDAPLDPGLELLTQATMLALTRVSSDRDHEQAVWTDLLLDQRAALGTDDPAGLLLSRAYEALLPAASDPEARGLALIALAASRWTGRCPDQPCGGLDRSELFSAASAWGPRSDALGRVWRVVALKDAIDDMETGQGNALQRVAMTQLADVLIGTGAGPLRASIFDDESPMIWGAIARSAGASDARDWPEARRALSTHGQRLVDHALAGDPDEQFRPLLERLKERL